MRLLGSLLFFFFFCLVIYGIQWMAVQRKYSIEEGFSNKNGGKEDEYVIGSDKLYDGFYAGIYDQLVQGQKDRIPFEVDIVDKYCKRLIPDKTSWSVLDVGCGTGDHISEFLKLGAGHVTGLDKSQAMINRARAKFPDKNVDWKIGDATHNVFDAEQFNIVCFFYFTLYYFPNRVDVFKNCYTWMKSGSVLAIHIVNRNKFDPILDSASPFPAFSLQKYAAQRVTESSVVFEKFTYDAKFDLEKEKAKFTETFKFKDGTIRKQEHQLLMPSMETIVKDAEEVGFRYRDYTDLRTIGYEYQYLLFFVK
jgi:ubiquinone/menaquinone biosynthesis C-methylase UbiE